MRQRCLRLDIHIRVKNFVHVCITNVVVVDFAVLLQRIWVMFEIRYSYLCKECCSNLYEYMKNVVVVDFAALLQRIWACVRPRTRRASYKMFTGVVCLSRPFPFSHSLSRARARARALSLVRSLLTLSLSPLL